MTPPSAPSPRFPPRPSTRWRWAVVTLLVVGFLAAFPPFRVVSKKKNSPAETPNEAFSSVAFATRFWTEQLQPSALRARDITPLLGDLRRDPVAAMKAHGAQVGLGHAAYYFARGSGRVVAVEKSRLLVQTGDTLVAIRIGPVFGNVVRDGCGLLDVNRAPGLQEFNAISAELNRLVEERIQPVLRKATVGATVTFAGCAEAPEALGKGPLLTFIPVQAEVTP